MKTLLKTLFIMLPLALPAFLTGCSDDSVIGTGKSVDEVQSQIGDDDIKQLVAEADGFAFLIDTGRVLRTASERDRLQVRGTIERVKASSILLDFNPNDRAALMSLKTAFKFFEKIVISERDEPRLQQVLDRARGLLVKYAAIQGVAIDDLQWEIFSYRFSNEVTPFGSPDSPNQWSIRFVQQERYAINVRGENKTAILLSPTFDLKNVKNPGYSLRHSFQVEEHFLPRTSFNRSKILSNAFKVMVSTKYNNKIESYDLVSIKGSPLSTYQRFIVAEEGLAEDGTVTVAEAANLPMCDANPFPADAEKCIVEAAPVNTITTERTVNIPPKETISLALRHRLNSQGGDQGAKIKIAEDTGDATTLEWTTISPKRTEKKIWERQDQVFFDIPAQFSGKKVVIAFEMADRRESTTWDLYYAALSVKNNGERWSRVWRHDFGRFGLKGFKVTTQGNAKNTFKELKLNPTNINEPRLWTRIGLGKLPTGLNFNTIDSGVIGLEEFVGKKTTLAMVYQNNNDLGNHILSWSIERFELLGVTDELSYEERPIPFDPDAQDALGKSLYRHNFENIQIGDLEQVTLSGAPAQFRNDERNGKKWVRAGDMNTEGEQLLYSPVIDLAGVAAPYVRIKQTLNFYKGKYKAEKDVRLQVAEATEGAEAKDLNWQIIDFPLNSPPGSDWKQYKSEFAPLPANLTGKKIRIGWYHRSRDDSSPAWQIIDTELRDIPELL